METKFTARHFKPHDGLREYALDAMEKLERYYDGIVRSEITLSFERARNSVKIAEVHVTVYGTMLKAVEKTDEYHKSIDAAVMKLHRQLERYKDKLHNKSKTTVRRIREKE